MTDQQAFGLLKSGDKNSLEWIYKTYRDRFVYWAIKKYEYEVDDAIALFTDTLIALERNVHSGNMTVLSVNMLTYLIAIAKNIHMQEQRLKHKKRNALIQYLEEVAEEDNSWETEETDAIINRLMSTIEKLGHPCKQLIELFYFERKRDAEIKVIMGYSSEDVVKNQRTRCKNQLRELLNFTKTDKK
jgi:RNA polymerase sigma-70 factor (ECF subfamily)